MKYATLSSRPVEFSASGTVKGSGTFGMVRNKTITYNRVCSTGWDNIGTYPITPSKLLWCGTYFVIGAGTTQAYKSTDGTNWTSVTFSQAVPIGGEQFCYVGNGKGCITSTNNSIYTIDGGSTWNNGTYNGFSSPSAVGFCGNSMSTDNVSTIISQRYQNAGAYNNLAYSTDSGANWYLTANLPNSYSSGSGDYSWHDGNYFLLTRYGIDTLWYSSDGIIWNFTTVTGMGAAGIAGAFKFNSINGKSYLLSYVNSNKILNTNTFTITTTPFSIGINAGYKTSGFTKDINSLNIDVYYSGTSYYLISEPMEYINYKTPLTGTVGCIAASPNYILYLNGTNTIWRKPLPLSKDTRTVTY